MHGKRLSAAVFCLFLAAALCLLGSCGEQGEDEREDMYFLADNNVSGALTVYRCDGEHYYEVWSMADAEDYVRVLDGDTLYYAPLFSVDSGLCSADLKTGKTKTFGEIPDGMVKKLAVGEAGVYALMVRTINENEGLYRIKSNYEPKIIASCNNAPGMGFFCRDGGVYYYPDPHPAIQRYDEKSEKLEVIVEAVWERNEYAFCDGDFIYRRYSLDSSTIRRFSDAVADTFFEQFNIKTGERQTFKDYSPELSLFCAHDGWIYCTRRIDNGDSACKTFFTRLSPETGEEEILGPYEPREGRLTDYITFGKKGFVFSGYASSEENAEAGHPVYYYYPYAARERIELSFAETGAEKENITVKTELSDKKVIMEVELSDGELYFKELAELYDELASEEYDNKGGAYFCQRSGLTLDDFSLDRARYTGKTEAMRILNIYPEKWAFPKGCGASLRYSHYFMPRFNLREDGKYDYDDFGMFYFNYQLGDNAYLTLYISPAPTIYSQSVSDYMISNLSTLRSRYGDMNSMIGDMPLSVCYWEDYGSAHTYYRACFTAGNAAYEIMMGGVTQREFIGLLISIYASPRPETRDFFDVILPSPDAAAEPIADEA